MTFAHHTSINHPKRWLDCLPRLDVNSHKYSRGHTMIVGGFPMTGASRLAAYAAARMGSGLTTVIVPEVAFSIYASALTSIMVKPFGDTETVNHLIDDPRITSFLIGPGAGVNDDTRLQSLKLLDTKRSVVLDADALTVFQGDVALLRRHLSADCVLTPHAGEFQRLFRLTDDRVQSAQLAAQMCGAVVVLKGSETVIASPCNRIIINLDAPAYLATGGSGDVLAGMIAGLIAQGMPSFEAACAAVWVHGEAAKLFGFGLIAEDLPALLPQVLNKLYSKSRG